MIDFLAELVSKYRNRGVLVDTNIFLLWMVGAVDSSRISQHKRTRQYTIDDFTLLVRFLDLFDYKVVATPNILTEVSNLLAHGGEKTNRLYFETFARHIPLLEECFQPSFEIAKHPLFTRFGLTDAGIADLVKDKYLVLTDDLALYATIQNLGTDALNFHHFRRFNS